MHKVAPGIYFETDSRGTNLGLVETSQGPVLIDTGLGLHDFSNPTPLVRFFHLDFGIHNDPESAAIRQIARLGYAFDVL